MTDREGVIAATGAHAMQVGVIGLGEAGLGIHLPALATIPGAVVVGACDQDPDRRARAAARWKVPVFDTVTTLLRDTRPGTVIVATPPATHAALAVQCMTAGAHVVVEKPFADSVRDADRMLQSAREHKVAIAVNHEFRYMPIFRAVLEYLRRPGADPPVTAQLWQLLDRRPWDDEGWRGRLQQRTLFEAGGHLVDLLMEVFAAPPETVSTVLSSGDGDGRRADAVVVATLEFPGGRLAHLVQNRLCRGEAHYADLRVDTGKASFRASFGGRARLSLGMLRSPRPHLRLEYGTSGIAWRETGQQRSHLARNPPNPLVAATRQLLSETLGAFVRGTRPPVGGDAGRDVVRIIAACYHAARVGRRVALSGPETEAFVAIPLGTAST